MKFIDGGRAFNEERLCEFMRLVSLWYCNSRANLNKVYRTLGDHELADEALKVGVTAHL